MLIGKNSVSGGTMRLRELLNNDGTSDVPERVNDM